MDTLIDMNAEPIITEKGRAYSGTVFDVDRIEVSLPCTDGSTIEVNRDVVLHSDVVAMLVHDLKSDRYLVTREYRAGANGFVYGIPAGFIDDGESPEQAMRRELREETGIRTDHMWIWHADTVYTSEGYSTEKSNVFIVSLFSYEQGDTAFDDDESVESTWVTWEGLNSLPIHGTSSRIAILHETILRMGNIKVRRDSPAHGATVMERHSK